MTIAEALELMFSFGTFILAFLSLVIVLVKEFNKK